MGKPTDLRREGENDKAHLGPGAGAAPPPATYAAFWPVYLAAHRQPRTRALHYLGTLAGAALLAAAAIRADWRLAVLAPVVGYASAWIGHAVCEKNRPATFGHPLWSFYSDLRMLGLWLTGRLGRELGRQDERG